VNEERKDVCDEDSSRRRGKCVKEEEDTLAKGSEQ
jgi:hypothetical protein